MSWPNVSLENFCQTGSGGTPARDRAERYYGGSICWVKSGELHDEILMDTEEHITPYAVTESSAKIVPPGTILIAMYGATVGKTAMLGIEAATNQAVCYVRPDPKTADAKFVWYALRAKTADLLAARVGGAQPNISQKIIREIKVPVPPLTEQRRIVEILDQADAIRKMRAAANVKAEGILPALFLKSFGRIESIEDWTHLGALTKEFRYGTSNKSEPEGYITLRIPNIVNGILNLEDLKRAPVTPNEFERIKLQQSDLLFVRTNGNPEYVGRSAIFEQETVAGMGLDPEKIIFASYLIRARLDLAKVEPLFVQSYLSLTEGRRALRERSRTSAGQYNINVESLRSIPVPRIEIEKQRSFALKARICEKFAALQLGSQTRIEDAFKSIMSHAFSGELTARWYKAHEKQLRTELLEQANALEGPFDRLEKRVI